MKQNLTVTPIAYVQSDFPEKFGIPRQSGRAPDLTAKLIFLPEFKSPDFFRGIDGFSHLWVLFDFSATRDKGYSATVRPPRLGGNERVGVFASRSPFRPNHIGLSCVKLERVTIDESEVSLTVSGADFLDGTPVLDVKPYLPFADCIQNATGGYASSHQNDGLQVKIADELLQKIPCEKRKGLLQCLADDPRPSYQEDGKTYGMRFAEYEIKFTVQKGVLTVTSIYRNT
ncbi:MAG: tRNA (N6-threonylcarbamoyladenosine(37)-N6)-methyltransferase TrmO [Clostridia bacterium]|nr:tRNA (N6-threonylcarbamoyladenosine(37)-N6)-methyltransferase TrmO [Clostridia bacterium]